jgi:serine/threonine-protein kinase RsbW
VDTVTIRIPASPAYVQVVRLVAAGLASRLKFTIDDIEDLKIAVDEVCAYLTGAQGREGDLHIRFTVADDRIEIAGTGMLAPGQKIRTDLTDFSRMILDTVVDSASLDSTNGRPAFSLVQNRRS